MIKAIETVYNGYRFRSRLEARWAVFFDTLGVRWEYEKEGYDLDGIWYLPDFWLPELKYWVEIKAQEPTVQERVKAKRLVYHTQSPLIFCCGVPSIDSANWVEFCYISSHEIVEFSGDYLFAECPVCHKISIIHCFQPEEIRCGCLLNMHFSSKLVQAYTAARQARFEHGEKP